MAPRAAASTSAAAPSPIYSLNLLTEYTHTLDSLPLDLSRNFADLRELDAVLSASMSTITSKITALTEMIEQGTGTHERRLWLLMEIAEEANRLRLGGEDKIRVACQAADNLRSHSTHLRQLTEHIPGFNVNALNRRTTYPHVASKPFMPATSLEFGRRRRSGFASLLHSAPDASPVKRKRGVRDDDFDHRSPRKGLGDVAPRPRNGGRKKVERAPSPTESLVSVTSHLPPQSNARGAAGTSSRAANGTAAKRGRAAAAATRDASNQPPPNEYYANGHHEQHVNGTARGRDFNVPPSSSTHPSLVPYNSAQNGHAGPPYDNGVHTRNSPIPPDWNPPHPGTLEGPGMPIARASNGINAAASASGAGGGRDGTPGPDGSGAGQQDGGDVDGENDDKPYCFCQRGSFGDMIACDNPSCQWEWFHLACLGMTTTPEGRWFCDTCRSKGTAKRPGRGGRRKASGRARA